MAEGQSTIDEFVVPIEDENHPQHYYSRVLEFPEHMHLREGQPNVVFLLRTDPLTEGGKVVLGAVHLPKVQGKLKGVFCWMLSRLFGVLPDYVVVLDRDYWERGSDRDREILMFHECLHMVQAVDKEGDPRYDDDGNPVWALRGHDVEEFIDTVRRYGAYSPDVQMFVEAAGWQGKSIGIR